MTTRRLTWLAGLAAGGLVVAGVLFWQVAADREAPRIPGRLVYVSDRSGEEQLYLRTLETGEERQLTHATDPVREPSCAPNGRQVAFALAGRIGVVDVATGEIQILSLGVEWLDAEPDWRGDGKALVVSSRLRRGDPGDIHELLFETGQGGPASVTRRPLTATAGLDERSPLYGYDGGFVVFEREDALFRLDAGTEHPRRLTAGFKKCRAPRLRPDGRIVFAWSLDKTFGLDVVGADGEGRETLSEGSVSYRTVAPSLDGRYLATTFSFDLAFQLRDALRARRSEEIRLLDARGAPLGTLVGAWLYRHHSPCWLP